MSDVVVAPGTLVKPSHGKGLLRRGSRPGQVVAGIGRPPSALRERLRGSFDERVAVLEEIADDPRQSPADRTRAIDILAKYGLGTLKEISTEDVQGRLRNTIALIRQRLPEQQANEILREMREVWR